MKLKTFAVVAFGTSLIIIAAAVGGAVGGQNIRSGPQSHDDAASQSSSVLSRGPDFEPTPDCPSAHNMPYISSYARATPPAGAGLRFQRYCDVNVPLQTSETRMIGGSFSSSFSDCIDTCAAYNYWNRSRNCTVALFDIAATRPSNCWIGSASSYDADSFSRSPGRDVALLLFP